MNMRFLTATALIAFAAFTVQPAKADITNGDFATGDFTGWTTSGSDLTYVSVGASTNTTDPSGPGFGNSALLGTNGSPIALSQTFSTVSGTTYDLSFFLQADGGPGTVTTLLDGTQVPALTIAVADQADWVQYTYQFVGTGSDSLEFDVSNDPSYFELTDVSTVAEAAAVPEPGTWTIVLAGVAGLAYGLRRRVKASPTFA